jgi:hypothetical protein
LVEKKIKSYDEENEGVPNCPSSKLNWYKPKIRRKPSTLDPEETKNQR